MGTDKEGINSSFDVQQKFMNLPSRSRWNLIKVPPVKGVNMQMKWFQPCCILQIIWFNHAILPFHVFLDNYPQLLSVWLTLRLPDTLLSNWQNRREQRGGWSWWCQTSNTTCRRVCTPWPPYKINIGITSPFLFLQTCPVSHSLYFAVNTKKNDRRSPGGMRLQK